MMMATAGFTENPKVALWASTVTSIGGTYDSTDLDICRNLVTAIDAATYAAKIVHLLPILGTNVAATRRALINTLGVGATATNTNFVDADYTRATGLKGNGSNKRFTLAFTPSQLGASNSGGMGYWENGIDFTGSGSEPLGATGAVGNQRFSLDLRSARRFASWGTPANVFDQSSAAVNGHYYLQRSSSTQRDLYLNGSLLGSNTSSDSASGAGDNFVELMAITYPGTTYYWKGRCACAYFTDGTLTSTEVSDFHSLLSGYLITPTGR